MNKSRTPHSLLVHVLVSIHALSSFHVGRGDPNNLLLFTHTHTHTHTRRVSRELLVTAYQCGTGLVNLVAPTSGVVMGALALGRIPFTAYLRFMAPLLVKLALLCVGVLVAGVALAH